MAQWPRSSSTRRTYQARSPGGSRRAVSRATSPRFPATVERLGELAPPVEPGRLERVEAADLGPQRVGAVPARLDRLARPLAVDRDEGEERAAVGGEGAAPADRLDDRRVGQLPGPAVHPAVARRRRAPPAEGAVGVAAGRDAVAQVQHGEPEQLARLAVEVQGVGAAPQDRVGEDLGRPHPVHLVRGRQRVRVDHGPAPGVDLLGDPLRGQRAVDEPGIDLRLDRPRDARRVQVADERAGPDLRRPAEEERRRAQPLDPGGGRARNRPR